MLKSDRLTVGRKYFDNKCFYEKTTKSPFKQPAMTHKWKLFVVRNLFPILNNGKSLLSSENCKVNEGMPYNIAI